LKKKRYLPGTKAWQALTFFFRIRGGSGADRAAPPGWFADSPAIASVPTPNRGRMPRLGP